MSKNISVAPLRKKHDRHRIAAKIWPSFKSRAALHTNWNIFYQPFLCAYFFLYKTSGSDVLVKLIASCMIGYHWSFMIGLNHCSLMYNIKEALLKEKFTVRCSSVTTRHDTTATLCTQGLDFVNATGVVRYSKANFHHLCLRNVPDCQKFPFRSPLRFTLVQTCC